MMNTKKMQSFVSISVAFSMCVLFSNTTSADEHGSITSRLVAGTDDVNTPQANAVVRITDGGTCTGTLISPNIVVTAGHCLRGLGENITEDSKLSCSDKQVPGRWYPLDRQVDVLVGNNLDDPEFTTIATDYNLPGCADIHMIRLRNAVPRTKAIPIKVLTSVGIEEGANNSDVLDDKQLTIVGWGGNDTGSLPSIRQIGTGSYLRHNDEKLWIRGDSGLANRGGDSGGPLLWTNPVGQQYLVAVLQGSDGSDHRYTPTFRLSVNKKPSVGDWFVRVSPSSVYCDDAINPPEGTLPLLSWWSPSRKDNMIKADPVKWVGCKNTIRGPDYRFVRTEGYIFNPTLAQPKGTVRLDSWYDPDRGDNYAATKPTWIHWWNDRRKRDPNYGYSGLEGYVYNPDLPQPTGTIPLYRWYSSDRKDHWSTTNHAHKGRGGEPVSPEYGLPRLAGYIFPASL